MKKIKLLMMSAALLLSLSMLFGFVYVDSTQVGVNTNVAPVEAVTN